MATTKDDVAPKYYQGISPPVLVGTKLYKVDAESAGGPSTTTAAASWQQAIATAPAQAGLVNENAPTP